MKDHFGNLECYQEKGVNQKDIKSDLTPKTEMGIDERIRHFEPLNRQCENFKNCI